MKKRKCSWRKARERTTMNETWDTKDDETYFEAQRCLQNHAWSSAKRIECAVRAVIKLYCTDVSCEWVSCLHSPSIFWNSFQETEITTIYQMMWNTMSSNSSAIVSFATAMLKMKTLPTGFAVSLFSTAIRFSDRHSNRSVLLLRIVDLLGDVVDVLDISV